MDGMPWIIGDRKNGYRVQWRTGGRGSPVKASRTFHIKSDAEAELRAVQAQHAEDRVLRTAASPSTPLPMLLKRWKASRIAGRRARADYCDEAIDLVTTVAEACQWTKLADITPEAIDRWITGKNGVGTDTPLRVIKGFCRWCRRTLRLRLADGLLDIEARRRPKKVAAPLLADDQVAKVLATAYEVGGFSVGVALEHLVLYGARPIDVCRLTVADWNGPARIVTYRATKNLDDIAHPVHEFHAAKMDELAKGKKPGDFLFSDPWGRPWKVSRGSAQAMAGWYYQNIGEHCLPMGQRGVYMLKRYALTRLAYASGGNRAAMATMSGHRTLAVMDRYLATNVETQAKMLAGISDPTLSPRCTDAAPTLPAPAEISVGTAVSTSSNPVQTPTKRRRRNPLKQHGTGTSRNPTQTT